MTPPDVPKVDEGLWKPYRKRPIVVRARRIEEDMAVEILEGPLTGRKGDWLVEGIRGELYPVADGIFQETYEREEMSEKLTFWVGIVKDDLKCFVALQIGLGLDPPAYDLPPRTARRIGAALLEAAYRIEGGDIAKR